MRRLARRLFTMCSAVSLVLCVAACVLWARTRRGEDRASAVFRGERYTARSRDGRVVLLGPPPQQRFTAPPTRRWDGRRWRRLLVPTHQPDDLAAKVRNEQLVWEIQWPNPETRKAGYAAGPHFSPRGLPGSPVEELAPGQPATTWEVPWSGRRPPYTLEQVARPLLAALEDPERFAAAAVVLGNQWRHPSDPPTAYQDQVWDAAWSEQSGGGELSLRGFREDADGTFVQGVAGLTVSLRPCGPERAFNDTGDNEGRRYRVRGAVAAIDPAQQQAVRSVWYGRLAVPIGSVAWRHACAASAVLPSAWAGLTAGRLLARRARHRRECCRSCGYDLRASPERCPKCGAAATTN